MTKRKKMGRRPGRPRRADGASRNVSVRLSPAEHAAAVALARRNGETVSELIRRFLRERQRELSL